MHFQQKHRLGLWLLILLSCLTLYLRHGQIITAQPHQVIQGYGDAFNAYNLVKYHSKHDSTYTAFEGMAYPYGDHVIIASAIPLLSNSLKFLKDIGLDLTSYSNLLLHYSMLFSYIACAIFLYLILMRFALPPWYSIILAIALTFMSPQTERLFGHFGLAHLYAIPATLYFLMRFDEKPNWKTSSYLFLTVLLSSLIQFYFFAITAFMIAAFYFFSFLNKIRIEKNAVKKWIFPRDSFFHYAIHFSFQVLLPYLIFTWWLAQYEVPNRPNKPYGYTLFITYWEGLFISLKMPYFAWIDEHLIKIRRVNVEGRAYLGLVSVSVLITMLFFWLRHFFQKSFFQKLTILTSKKVGKISDNELKLSKGLEQWVYDDADFLKRLFAMSILLLLFSFGLPFSLPHCEWLLDYAGPIKQFRSVGRFNWIFYYVLNIVAFVFLYRKISKKIWLLLPLSILIYEAWQFNHSRPYRMQEVPEFKRNFSFQERSTIDFNAYQALLPIPYFNIGTDNFDATLSGRIQQKSLALSMETGLPMLASMGNRSSVSRAYKLFQVVAEPYQKPSILTDFKNSKPLLLMVDSSKTYRFPFLEEGTTFLETVDAMHFYELSLEAFTTRIDNRKKEIEKTREQDSTFYQYDSFLSQDSNAIIIHKGFDDQKTSNFYKGTGSLELDISSEQSVFKQSLDGFKKGDKVVVSFWCDLSTYPAATTFVKMQLSHPHTKANLWEFKPQIRYLIPIWDNNGWCLVEQTVEILEDNAIFELSIWNNEMGKHSFFLDELIIRKEGENIFHKDIPYFKNNRYY